MCAHNLNVSTYSAENIAVFLVRLNQWSLEAIPEYFYTNTEKVKDNIKTFNKSGTSKLYTYTYLWYLTICLVLFYHAVSVFS